ncbi:MAG: GAF domain-containing protein [Novosphingobium sp.]
MSGLRAVSPIHIEYLRNMGVKASMSVSIMSNGELWGLPPLFAAAPRLRGANGMRTVWRIHVVPAGTDRAAPDQRAEEPGDATA